MTSCLRQIQFDKVVSHNPFGAKFQMTFVDCFFVIKQTIAWKKSLNVKLKDRMSISVDPVETAHNEPFHLGLCVCKSLLLSPVAVKELRQDYSSLFVSDQVETP